MIRGLPRWLMQAPTNHGHSAQPVCSDDLLQQAALLCECLEGCSQGMVSLRKLQWVGGAGARNRYNLRSVARMEAEFSHAAAFSLELLGAARRAGGTHAEFRLKYYSGPVRGAARSTKLEMPADVASADLQLVDLTAIATRKALAKEQQRLQRGKTVEASVDPGRVWPYQELADWLVSRPGVWGVGLGLYKESENASDYVRDTNSPNGYAKAVVVQCDDQLRKDRKALATSLGPFAVSAASGLAALIMNRPCMPS